jgi:membrane-associated phospholipid phosphatase
VLLLVSGQSGHSEEYLSAGEVSAIGGGTVLTLGVSAMISRFDSTRGALIGGPLPGEASIQRWLGGQPSVGKQNFLDGTTGSMITPLALGAALATVDASWPRDDKSKELAQDFFLYTSGLLATKGFTGIVKGLVARERPLPYFAPHLVTDRSAKEYRFDRQSFFSGHASSAFFASAFLNLRMRTIMRAELTGQEYRDWRWAPPALLFGWASYVGVSRIEAYRHYLSDVVMGAVAGVLMAELFFSFTDRTAVLGSGDQSRSTPMMFRVAFRF